MATEFIKDIAVTVGGVVTGLLVDQAVGLAWSNAGLPDFALGPVHLDDLILMAAEGIGAYLAYGAGQKEIGHFLIGMFGEIVAMEVYEGLVDAGIIPGYQPVLARAGAEAVTAPKFIPSVLMPKYQYGGNPYRPGLTAVVGARPQTRAVPVRVDVGPYAGGMTAPKFIPGPLLPTYTHGR